MNRAPLTSPSWQQAVRGRSRLLVLTAILLSVLFGVLVFYPYAERLSAMPHRVQAVFARADIAAGSILTGEILEMRTVPEDALPPGRIERIESVVGRAALYPMVAGEAVLPHKLLGGVGGPIAQRCPSAGWCVNVPGQWFAAPAPALAEGDRVAIAAYLPDAPPEQAGLIAVEVRVVQAPANETEAIILSMKEREALALLYAWANEFKLLLLLRPAGG